MALSSLGACDSEVPRAGTQGRLAIEVSPLSLTGVRDVFYLLTVVADGEVVWEQLVSSRQYGDGAGSLTYIGPCDASAQTNTVLLDILEIQDDNGAIAFVDPTASAPLSQDVECRENADTLVVFDITVMRPAQQGFFDVAVDFDDIFCSAKVDCVDAEGEDNLLLFDPESGRRVPTAVMATACTAGPGQATELYLDALVLDCGAAGVFDVPIDTGVPGNVYQANPAGPLMQVATYFGTEALSQADPPVSLAKLYFNVAIALDADALGAGATCTLRSRLTAHDGALDECRLGPGLVYPWIEIVVTPFADQDGLACARHALDDPQAPEGTGVFTGYLDHQVEHQFHTRIHVADGGAALVVEGCPECGLQVPPLPGDLRMDDCFTALALAENGLNESASYLQMIEQLLIQAANGTLDPGTLAAYDQEVAAYVQAVSAILQDTTHDGHRLFDGSEHTFVAAPFGQDLACYDTGFTDLAEVPAELASLSAMSAAAALASLTTARQALETIRARRFVVDALAARAQHDVSLGGDLRRTLGDGVLCDNCDPLAVQFTRVLASFATGMQEAYNLGSACIGLCSTARSEVAIGTRSALERLAGLRSTLVNVLNHSDDPLWSDAYADLREIFQVGYQRALGAIDVGGGPLLFGVNAQTAECFGGETFDLGAAALGLDALGLIGQGAIVDAIMAIDDARDAIELATIAGGMGNQDALIAPRAHALQDSVGSLQGCGGLLGTAEGALGQVALHLAAMRSICDDGTGFMTPQERAAQDGQLANLAGAVERTRTATHFAERQVFAGGTHTWLALLDRQAVACLAQDEVDLGPIANGLAALSVESEAAAGQCLVALDGIDADLADLRALVGARLAVVSRQIPWADQVQGHAQLEDYRQVGADLAREIAVYMRLNEIWTYANAFDRDVRLVPYQSDLHPQLLFMAGFQQRAEADRDLALRKSEAVAQGAGEGECDPARVRAMAEARWITSGVHDRFTDDLTCTGPCYLARLHAMYAADSIRGRIEGLRGYAASLAVNAPVLRQDVPALVADWLVGIDQVAAAFDPDAVPGCFSTPLDFSTAALGLSAIALDSEAGFAAAIAALDAARLTLDTQLQVAGFLPSGLVLSPRAGDLAASAASLDACASLLVAAELAHASLVAIGDDVAAVCQASADPSASALDRVAHEAMREALAAEATRVTAATRLHEGPALTSGGASSWRYAFGDELATCLSQAELDLSHVAQAIAALDAGDEASSTACAQAIDSAVRPALATWSAAVQGRKQRAQLETALARALADLSLATVARETWTDLGAVFACHQGTLAAIASGDPLAPCAGLDRPALDVCEAARPLAQVVIEHAIHDLVAMLERAYESADPATTGARRQDLAIPFADLLGAYDRMIALASLNGDSLLSGANATSAACFGTSYALEAASVGVAGLDVSTQAAAQSAIDVITSARSTLEAVHGAIGNP